METFLYHGWKCEAEGEFCGEDCINFYAFDEEHYGKDETICMPKEKWTDAEELVEEVDDGERRYRRTAKCIAAQKEAT